MSGAKAKATKKQHYVPQLYLRKFANSDEQLYVYEKDQRMSHPSNVVDIAQKRYFYDFPQSILDAFAQSEEAKKADPELVKKALDPQLVEHELGRIESDFVPILDEMVDLISRGKWIKDEHRFKTAHFMAVQALRTAEFRQQLSEIMGKFGAWLGDQFKLADDNLVLEYNKDFLPIQHALMILSPDMQERLTRTFFNHVWMVGVNSTSQPFYTSDMPVVKRGHIKDPFKSYEGFGSPGIEIAFPLTPKYILILCDRQVFEGGAIQEGRRLKLGKQAIIHYNSLQVIQSYRQVFCSEEKFGLAEQICREHPEVCDLNRDRVQVQ